MSVWIWGERHKTCNHKGIRRRRRPVLGKVLMGLSAATLVASIVVVAVGIDQHRSFPWGTHMVTVTAVLLLGVIAGWWLRERQAAEDRAREEIDANRKDQ